MVSKLKINHLFRLLLWLALLLGAIPMLLPLLWTISTSLKSLGESFIFPPKWLPDKLIWHNYLHIFELLPIGYYFKNTLIVATSVVIGRLMTSVLGAYAFARFDFPGRDILFFLFLGTLMIPSTALMVPRFIIIKYLGWIDSYQALIVPRIFTAFGVFMLRQFFLAIPSDVIDAAKIDGCSTCRILLKVILPLSKPALATLAIFTVIDVWNDLTWPLIVINSPKMKVLSLALTSFQGLHTTNWPLLTALATLAQIPLISVYLLLQKHLVKGMLGFSIGMWYH